MLSRLSIHALGLLSVSGLGWAAATSMSADTRMHCSSLLNTTLTGNVSILETTFHEAHTVNSTSGSTQIYNTYSFCRVSGAIAYGHNSSLNFLVYLPEVDTYNGRFMAVGNGGMAGVVDDFAMMQQLNTGFAVAGGDAGHLAARNNGGSGAPDTYIPYLHDKDQVEAWIHNAISLFVPASKALIANYYNKRPRYSYYIGCSTGGAQGFALAQYHPELFDGIIAGCPGNWYSHLALSFLWNSQKAPVNTSSYLNQATLNTLQAAALQACDEIDGVKDGVIENPLLCKFDIDTLACTGPKPSNGNSSEAPCLTSTEIAAAKAIYAGPVNSATNRSLYPGFAHGSEGQWILQEGDLSAAFSVPILQNLVFDNLTYDASKFNWDSDVKAVDTNAGALIDAISVNLTAFRDKGSKMLVYQGWADPYNAQTWPIEHLKSIRDFFGGDVSDFYNLFMIPGFGHCGPASLYPSVPAELHVVPELIKWVERNEKPRSLLSTKPQDGTTRSHKLCPWPQTAVYVQGDQGDWNSYVCEG